ncbi:MAG: SRPBCC family protein [Vicinamibacterales bacterium]
MAKVRVSSEVRAPVDQVFGLFTDIEHAAERVSGIKKIEIMSTGPINLGFRWCETREVLGRLDDAEMEITSFESNHTYTVTHHKSGVRIDTVFTFEPVPAGTKVSVEFELNSQGLPPGLLLPLDWAIGGKVRHVLSDDLADLKESIEHVVRS